MRLIAFIFLSLPIIGFTQTPVDTIVAYEHPPIDINTLGPPGTIESYVDSAYAYPTNITYYIKFHDIDSNIVFEALEYNRHRIGKTITYHKNGNVKTKGYYTGPTYRRNGKVKKYPRKTGKWTYHSKTGKLIRTDYYK